jgi:hypothetical protein
MPRAERETVRVSRVRKKQVIWPVLQESERQLNVCWEGGVDSLTHTHTRLLSRFFKRWKCGLIVSRGRFLIISVTTSYIIGITKVRSLLVFLPSLFCWVWIQRKKNFSLPPLSCFRYGGCWKQEPPRASDLPYQLLLIVLQGSPVFFSNGLFCLPTPDVSASEGDTKGGEHVGCYGYRPP